MILEGKVVRFRLSPEGETALAGLFDKKSLQAFVQSVDELGVWILMSSTQQGLGSLLLLKWDYFSTAVVETDLKPPAERTLAGFKG